jgi:cation:H+ antiporter
MSSYPAALVILIFLAAAAATWAAGIELSKATDELDRRLNLGDAIGGMVLLSLAGSLPELAITISAASSGNLSIAAGNLIGGIATATMVLVICDLFAPRPLTYLCGSLIPVLEGMLVVGLIAIVSMGSLLPDRVAMAGVSPASVALVVAWFGGVFVLNNARSHPKWDIEMAGSKPGRAHHRSPHPKQESTHARHSMKRVVGSFLVASLVTLVAGVLLEISGAELAGRAHVNLVVFGATFLALASALPEISSGIEAVRLGDHQLAIADIFGGNAFQLCLFIVADILAGKPALTSAGHQNAWLAGLSVVLTIVYIGGIITRPSRPNRLGPDSILAIAIYAIGIVGLLLIAG